MNSGYQSPNSNMPPAMQAVQQVSWPSVNSLLKFRIRGLDVIFDFRYKQAAAVAARLAQSIGHTVNEEIRLPEKVAPLLSGRCGNDDELKTIQAQANCKITFSRDSG